MNKIKRRTEVMLGSLFLFLLSLPQREKGKGGEMGEKGVEKPIFYNFFQFHPFQN